MRIGTRLTLVLLLCIMPVLAAYTYWTVERSNVYVNGKCCNFEKP
ncbi:MAG: hypothetical protein ABSD31_14575 [Candidatus Binataceae bacterium]